MGLLMSDREIANYYRSLKHPKRDGVKILKEICNTSADEIRAALAREGIVDRKRIVHDKGNAEKQRLYNLGLCDREISERTGLTIAAVRFWRSKNGLPQNQKQEVEGT